VAEDDAWQGLDLDIGHGRPLRLGKAADLVLGKADVVHVAGGHPLHRGLDLGSGQTEPFRAVAVEFLGQRPNRRIAPRRDIGERRLDNAAHPGVVLGALGLGLGAFQVFASHAQSPCPLGAMRSAAS
jgi:hypothetical protein